MNDPKHYSTKELEAALCVWESLIETKMQTAYKTGSNDDALITYWEAVGTVHMRNVECPAIAEFVLAVYDAMTQNEKDEIGLDGYSYDWEIVPAIMGKITWSGTGMSRPDIQETARAIVAHFAEMDRKSDNKSAYFQPGDNTAKAIESARHCFALPEMFAGENGKLFNQWCGQYAFSGFSK